MKRVCLSLALLAAVGLPAGAAAPPGAAARQAAPRAKVILGIDVLLAEKINLLAGKRIGLITNRAAIDGGSVTVLDRMLADPRLHVAALLTPEHGFKADRQGLIASGTHEGGIPIHSLYGKTKKPTPEMLDGLDILVVDLPDVGARFYTYASTMALAMQAAKEARMPIVVLDRPNPINGNAVEGFLLDPKLASFTGYYPIPVRHGMTMGEQARMFNDAFEIGSDLAVIPMKGWSRAMYFTETGLPWANPSPAMRSETAALLYPGICLFEASNVDCRMGDRPFERIGAPWIDGEKLAKALNDRGLPGARFTPTRVGEKRGVRVAITDRDRFQAVRTGAVMLEEIQRLHPGKLRLEPKGFDNMAGNAQLRQALLGGKPVSAVIERWERDAGAFMNARRPYLLYE